MKPSINWRKPSDPPKNGEYVAVLIYHWKNCWPLSAEIYFGEVEDSNPDPDTGEINKRVLNNDYIGCGSAQWYFKANYYHEQISAWAYASEFIKPDFIEHNLHYGEIK